ncbi:monocarboxylate transporter 2 isoform X2 [Cydia amplana]|uniref:monocarboxylate transporter 2 isoform X2 n=1 Tax=Cydia amplana TaxID=1869771 RepID=UPI002FE68CD1
MVVRVATDERPLETPSSDESGLGRDSPSEESEPEAALVVPPDGGWGWVIVFASFMCNVVVDGIIFCGGMLNDPIKKEFNASDGQVAPVQSLLAGFYLLAGPFVSALANKYGFRVVTIVGSVISTVAFGLSYFATSVEYLYLVYGIIGGLILLCIIFGALFRPIKPVRVALADQTGDDDVARRHEEAVEKLNSMLKLHSKLDSGISMPAEMRFSNKVSPHTWVGVANNTRYPTAEEVFRGSNSHLSRRSSATAGTIKNTLGNRPMFITGPVAEKDEDDSNSNIDNTEPLISAPIKVIQKEVRPRHSHADLIARPLYRDDIFFSGSLVRLPQYTSRNSLGYHMAVTHVPTKEDTQEEESGKCRLCPEAVKRTLATMLDVSLFRSPTFVILAVSGFFTMLGFFVPYMYVKQRAMDKGGIDATTSTLLVSTIGVANIVGRMACGVVSSMPKVSPLWLNNIALTAGGIATMFSGYCFHAGYQFAYCALFGLAVACFASLRSILVVEYIGLEQLTNCFGLFLLFQGFGALLGSPIAGAIKDMTGDFVVPFYVAGGFLLFSALMCYPIDYISRWEKSRSKLATPSPKV